MVWVFLFNGLNPRTQYYKVNECSNITFDEYAMHINQAINARRASDERADRLQMEVNRLAEELRQEQDNFKNADAVRRSLEVEIREITVRLEEAEAYATREGKRLVAKLQARVRLAYIFLYVHFLILLLI